MYKKRASMESVDGISKECASGILGFLISYAKGLGRDITPEKLGRMVDSLYKYIEDYGEILISKAELIALEDPIWERAFGSAKVTRHGVIDGVVGGDIGYAHETGGEVGYSFSVQPRVRSILDSLD